VSPSSSEPWSREGGWARLGEVVGAAHLRLATPADAVAGVLPRAVIAPGSATELAAVLRHAHDLGLRLAPRGGGTKMEWGNPPRGLDLIVSTRRLERVVEHAWADMTATVEAGCTVAGFQRSLAEHGQRLSLDPLWPDRATIGGVLATNDSGSLRVRFGAMRDLVVGITVALVDGTLARSGGKVVKNVAGYDLPKLMAGSLGTLAVITEATFRLYPLPRRVRSLSFVLSTAEAVSQVVLTVLDSTLVPTGLQIRAQTGGSLGVDIRLEGEEAALDARVEELRRLVTTKPAEAPPEIWDAREALWVGAEPAVVCRLAVLPTRLGALCERVEREAEPGGLSWRMVAQAGGLAWLRLEGSMAALLDVLRALRRGVEAEEGSLALLHCPLEARAGAEAWGAPGDSLPLMHRVKEQFDPAALLNPGRFVGGI
jgi:glycolate oxidase FAD binding subunit